jgi:hypothetical protein
LKVLTTPSSDIALAKLSIASLIYLETEPSPVPFNTSIAPSLASILAIASAKSEGSSPKKDKPF